MAAFVLHCTSFLLVFLLPWHGSICHCRRSLWGTHHRCCTCESIWQPRPEHIRRYTESSSICRRCLCCKLRPSPTAGKRSLLRHPRGCARYKRMSCCIHLVFAFALFLLRVCSVTVLPLGSATPLVAIAHLADAFTENRTLLVPVARFAIFQLWQVQGPLG